MSDIPTQVPLLTNSPNEEQPVNGRTVSPQPPTSEDHNNRRAPYKISNTIRYMECLKNHAIAVNPNAFATDGCGEFLAGGEEGTIEAVTCFVCKCHRNYHRQVIIEPCSDPQCCPPAPTVPPAQVEEGVVKKRFRTKFTQEQKEKMHEFAEKSEWKIQKLGDSEVKRFCEEIGIQRNVLKVWMHNNKYHTNKKASSSSTN